MTLLRPIIELTDKILLIWQDKVHSKEEEAFVLKLSLAVINCTTFVYNNLIAISHFRNKK